MMVLICEHRAAASILSLHPTNVSTVKNFAKKEKKKRPTWMSTSRSQEVAIYNGNPHMNASSWHSVHSSLQQTKPTGPPITFRGILSKLGAGRYGRRLDTTRAPVGKAHVAAAKLVRVGDSIAARVRFLNVGNSVIVAIAARSGRAGDSITARVGFSATSDLVAATVRLTAAGDSVMGIIAMRSRSIP